MEGTRGWAVRRAGDHEVDEVARWRIAFMADVRGWAPAELGESFAAATRAFVRDRTSAGRLRSWFAEGAGGGCIGIVSMVVVDAAPLPEDRRDRDGYVINMYVAPEARGRGVARALLGALLADAEATGLRRTYLHSTDDGRPLYEQEGFAPDPRWMARPTPPA
ncbi:MAG: GNAT family N-acetyltransferase [Actinobacteria bacterium]|nr:GNAT family N-acetyltransferase [Actinomycetota bacterium]